MRSASRWTASCAALAATGLLAAGCGSSSSSSSGSTSSSSSSSSTSSALGTPHKATGSPYVFGLINDEAGPVTFPEARQGALAAANYLNTYKNGISGHPIKIVSCIGDASPATSARCASQLADKHPVAILGAADVGSPAAIPVYARANLAYIGGIPFTPVEQNAPNSVQFWSISLGDNAAASVYAGKTLGVKKAAVLYFNNPQGKVSGVGVIPPTLKAAGVSTVNAIGVPPTTPDPSAQAAAAAGGKPDLIYVDVPNNCGNMLKALKSVGYTGKLMAIDPCSDPRVIQSAAGGAEGMYVASPFVFQHGSDPQAKLFMSAMQKYAPSAAVDSISTAAFATVVNTQAALAGIKGTPTTATILKAFKAGSNHPNFLSHPYTCDGQAMAGAKSICNDYYLMDQVKNGQLTQPSSTDWTTSKGIFQGLKQ